MQATRKACAFRADVQVILKRCLYLTELCRFHECTAAILGVAAARSTTPRQHIHVHMTSGTHDDANMLDIGVPGSVQHVGFDPQCVLLTASADLKENTYGHDLVSSSSDSSMQHDQGQSGSTEEQSCTVGKHADTDSLLQQLGDRLARLLSES